MRSSSAGSTILVLAALVAPSAPAEGATWRRIGPEGGVITSLVSLPGRPDSVLASFLDGGIFRSEDRGATWSFSGNGAGRLSVASLAPVPGDPNTLFATSSTLGVIKSIDGGRTWGAAAGGIPLGDVFPVLAVAADARRGAAYVALRSGTLYKTVDGGQRWTPLPTGAPREVQRLVADPLVAGTVYAEAYTEAGTRGVWKSTNGGKRWRRLGRGLAPDAAIGSLTIDPLSPQVLYVLASDHEESRLFRSANRGESWSPLDLPAEPGSFALDPASPGTIYVGTTEGILRSSDGGTTWRATGATPEGRQFRMFAAAATVMANPFGGGLFRSTDGGDSWSPVSGMRARSALGLAVAPGPRLYASVVSGQTPWLRSDDAGAGWTPLPAPEDPALRLVGPLFTLDPRAPSTIYASALRTLVRSSDGGDHWQAISTPPCLFPDSLTVDPVETENLYVAGQPRVSSSCPIGTERCGVYRKLGKADWECIDGELPGVGVPVAAVDPFAPSHLYAWFPWVIYHSADRGAHWSLLAGIDFLSAIALDPTRPGVVYAGFLEGTGRSYDGGATWDLTSRGISNEFVHHLVVDPSDGRTLYAASQVQVYRSRDEGRTWRRAGLGLAETVIRSIALDPAERILYAATNGGGVLRLDLDEP